MPNINDAFPSNYLKASDLGGAQPIVTIDRVEFEAVGREREMKPVLYFVGKEKGIVLNKTNAKNIAGLTGSFQTEEWVGMRIRLYATHVEFNGETVETIRIKAAPPAGNGARPTPPPPPAEAEAPMDDSDIPF